jgi:hypothetical protein
MSITPCAASPVSSSRGVDYLHLRGRLHVGEDDHAAVFEHGVQFIANARVLDIVPAKPFDARAEVVLIGKVADLDAGHRLYLPRGPAPSRPA